jgi:hypothetical protein
MQITTENLWYWGLILLAIAVIVYLLPFLISLWIKPVMALWGFIIGRRQRNALVLPDYPKRERVDDPGSSASGAEATDSARAYNLKSASTESLKHESDYLEDMYKKKMEYLNGRLKSIEDKIDGLNKNHQEQQEKDQKNFPGNIYYTMLNALNKTTAKDFLLFLIISALFIADTLIAQQVFTSLGLFPTDKYEILGKEIHLTFILGLFLTAVAALFLHMVWDRKKLTDMRSKKLGMIIGLVVLVLLAALRFISVVAPLHAKAVVEMALILSWIMGVVVFYWLLGEILGETSNWYDLFIAIGLPILLTLVAFFGTLFLLEKFIEWLMKSAFKGWFELRHARTMRQKQNAEESHQAITRGFYRGLTF